MTKADRPISQRPTARALRAAVARSGMKYPEIAKAIGMNAETLRDWCHYRPLTIYSDEPSRNPRALPGEFDYTHQDTIERLTKTLGGDIFVGLELSAMWQLGNPIGDIEPNPWKWGDDFLELGYSLHDGYGFYELGLNYMGLDAGEYIETFYEILVKNVPLFAERWAPETFGDRFEFVENR